MEAMYQYLNDLHNINKSTFSNEYNINWLNSYNGNTLLERRKQLLELNKEEYLYKETKPYYKHISNGCKMCGDGLWSCLFITNICNGACFYCPTSQNKDEIPSSQGMTFDTPEAYAEYVNYFKLKGVAISGGEPLLVFDRTLNYIKAIRDKGDSDIYIWMYTNGILIDEHKLRLLASAGLNEIRFDIGATNYSLDKIKLAKGIIKNISIEIPSIPEELEILKSLLPEMIKVGVSNLNLHQLRLTKHNAKKLLSREYTYVSDERPIVLESEIAALELINYARENKLDIGINYCSFHYKNRFQKAGYRNQINRKLAASNNNISENGFIRTFANNKLRYDKLVLSDLYSESKDILSLNNKTYSITKVNVMSEILLDETQSTQVEKLIESKDPNIPKDSLLFEIWKNEHIESKLRDY